MKSCKKTSARRVHGHHLKQIVCLFAVIFCILSLCLTVGAEKRAIFRNTGVTGKKIALTFDDGPHPKQTTEILKILADNDVHATFFVIGCNVEEYSWQIPRILAAGHEIGNHSYHHPCVEKPSAELVASEIQKCEKALYDVAEYRPKFFRPPGGIISPAIENYCADSEYSVILWSIDTRDWTHRDPDAIVTDVLKTVRPGDIILMHDYIGGSKSPTPTALRRLIPELKKMGYEFCTISELLKE